MENPFEVYYKQKNQASKMRKDDFQVNFGNYKKLGGKNSDGESEVL